MHLLRWKVFTLIVNYVALIISRKVRNLASEGAEAKPLTSMKRKQYKPLPHPLAPR